MKPYFLTTYLLLAWSVGVHGEVRSDRAQRTIRARFDAPDARLDAQERQISLLAVQVDELTKQLAMSNARRRGSTTDMVLDWGVRVNDPSFDNGKVISEAIASGNVSGAIFAPSGAIYHTTTINLGGRTGLKIIGGGVCHQLPEVGFTTPGSPGGAFPTRFIYLGPADQPAWKYQGLGLSLDGIVIQRGNYGDANHQSGTGFLLQRPAAGNPTGKMHWGQICFANWNIGVDVQGHNHCDNSAVDWCWFQNNETAMRIDNGQAVNWDFQFVKASGGMERVFHYARGAGLHISTFDFSNTALVLQLDKTSSNNCDVRIDRLKVDNNAKGWRLVEMTRPGPIYLRVDGLVGVKAAPGQGPVMLKNYTVPARDTGWLPPAGYHDVEIDLYGAPLINAYTGKSGE